MKKILLKLLKTVYRWLIKQADNKNSSKLKDVGIAAREIDQVIKKVISSSKNGVIDRKELELISKESLEAILAVTDLFGGIEIKVKPL